MWPEPPFVENSMKHNCSDLKQSFATRSSKVSSLTLKSQQLKWTGDWKSPDGMTLFFRLSTSFNQLGPCPNVFNYSFLKQAPSNNDAGCKSFKIHQIRKQKISTEQISTASVRKTTKLPLYHSTFILIDYHLVNYILQYTLVFFLYKIVNPHRTTFTQ